MSADTHVIKIVELENEGSLDILIQSWESPTVEEILKKVVIGPNAYPLHHAPHCGGQVSCIKITDTNYVLICNKCYMRLNIKSTNIITLDDLRMEFLNKKI